MRIVSELEVTDNKKLVLSIGEFRNKERIDLRQNTLIKGNWFPTKRGLNFDLEWIDKFIEMVEKLKDY